MATRHTLAAERATLHGHFSRDLPPVLSIDPGDSVRFQTLEAGWHLEPHPLSAVTRRVFEGRDPELDAGHALTGPVFIRGARPGMTLAVHIEAIRVGTFGTTFAGGWPSVWNDRLGVSEEGVVHAWVFDQSKKTARNQHGHTVKLRPFMGVYGLAPGAPGVHSTIPPRRVGGNIDCRELIAGSTLYLPIEAEGALFSTGDGHAAQGDGEVSVTAIECPIEAVDLRFELAEDMPLTTPVADTPAGWITLGFDEDLDEAMVIALESMLSLIGRIHNVERLDALALASVTVNFHVTQVVNGVRGVHALLPRDAIGRKRTTDWRPLHLELTRILWEEWDPIGVNRSPGTIDEYDKYAHGTASLLLRGEGWDAVADYLWYCQTESMGLRDPPREHTDRIAAKCVAAAELMSPDGTD